MRASIVDLRYHMNDVLKALERQEKVEILYHGKLKAFLVPAVKVTLSKDLRNHPYVGSMPNLDVLQEMDQLRRTRYS